ncbi:MAG TPA: excinuclease ABC subunit UvrC [Syntrophales bacterium]|nr:excinuclease ABC subunit UvrC [Syntrophales bacterium]
MDSELQKKIASAPREPGVYLMRDGEGKVLYVGKAKDLRSRVRAYSGGADTRFMIPYLVSRLRDVEFVVTGTEKEALILENNLIKEHRPRYNVDFRDDKAFYHLRIDPRDAYPRFQLVRRPVRDGAKYYGPYPSAAAARETLVFVQSVFPLRTCRDREMAGRRRPCLEYEIGRCLAPCVSLVDEAVYRQMVEDSLAFLEGRRTALLQGLRKRMDEAAEALQFELAARLRDRIAAVDQTLEKQRMEDVSGRDQDVFGVARSGEQTQVCLMRLRRGRIVGHEAFPVVRLLLETGEILSSVLKQYYDGQAEIPPEIAVPLMPEDGEAIAEWLSEKRSRRVALQAPIRGRARDLVAMASRNAEHLLAAEKLKKGDPREALKQTADFLGLRRVPERIEAFDISNLGGAEAVGVMVVFRAGTALKSAYRRFRVRTVAGADDYGMMREVLQRRYGERKDLPDLLVVDGGKGQLGVALAVLRDLGIDGVDAVGLAKEGGVGHPGRGGVSKDQERVYLPGRREPVYPARRPPVLHLLQRIRDEAHRFAVAYHRTLRRKRDLRSPLDAVPGIGEAKKRALLRSFGDLRRIREASAEELQAVRGIGPALAAEIRQALSGQRD